MSPAVKNSIAVSHAPVEGFNVVVASAIAAERRALITCHYCSITFDPNDRILGNTGREFCSARCCELHATTRPNRHTTP